MEASLLLVPLRRLRLGLRGLFGTPRSTHPVRLRAVEGAAGPAGARSVIAAFEQGGTQRRAARPGIVKLALMHSAAPVVASMPVPTAPAVLDEASAKVVHLVDVRARASRPRLPSSISAA